MAIGIENLVNTNPPDSDFPHGDLRDNPGDNTGTPVNRLMLSDPLQFFMKLMDEAGVSPNGIVDSEYNGNQFYESLRALFPLNTIMFTGTWNMDTTATVSIAHGLPDFLKIRQVSCMIVPNAGASIVSLSADPGSTVSSSDETEIILSRAGGGAFDSAGYNAATYYLTIQYAV